jgi:hypothetical protein
MKDQERTFICCQAEEAMSDVSTNLNWLYLPPIFSKPKLLSFSDFLVYSGSKNPNIAILLLFSLASKLRGSTSTQSAVSYQAISSDAAINGDHPKAVSWLIHDPINDVTTVCIDRQRIIRDKTPMQNVGRLLNYCMLHEIGHVFRHSIDLFNPNQIAWAEYANADSEAEAWCFALSVITHAVEHTATEYRNASPQDRLTTKHVWEHIRDSDF